MIFHEYTLSGMGQLRSHRQHESHNLVRTAVDLFTRLLSRNQELPEWISRIDEEKLPGLGINIEHSEHGAIARFLHGGFIVTISALVYHDKSAHSDSPLRTLERLVAQLSGSQSSVIEIFERPLMVTIPMPPLLRDRTVIGMIADMETCLAAAYFERCERELLNRTSLL